MRLIDADALKKDWGMANKCEDCPRDERDCQHGMVLTRMDVCGMLDEAPTVDRWIMVKDKLPELYEAVLVYSYAANGAILPIVAWRNENGWVQIDKYFWKPYCWMPLPELPEEVS